MFDVSLIINSLENSYQQFRLAVTNRYLAINFPARKIANQHFLVVINSQSCHGCDLDEKNEIFVARKTSSSNENLEVFAIWETFQFYAIREVIVTRVEVLGLCFDFRDKKIEYVSALCST